MIVVLPSRNRVSPASMNVEALSARRCLASTFNFILARRWDSENLTVSSNRWAPPLTFFKSLDRSKCSMAKPPSTETSYSKRESYQIRLISSLIKRKCGHSSVAMLCRKHHYGHCEATKGPRQSRLCSAKIASS